MESSSPKHKRNYRIVHRKGVKFLTFNGFGTRIVPVSYIALRPRASASNIDGPMPLSSGVLRWFELFPGDN